MQSNLQHVSATSVSTFRATETRMWLQKQKCQNHSTIENNPIIRILIQYLKVIKN